jgi:hypothetical protein
MPNSTPCHALSAASLHLINNVVADDAARALKEQLQAALRNLTELLKTAHRVTRDVERALTNDEAGLELIHQMLSAR